MNDAAGESPEVLNEDPYGDGWLAKVKLSDPSEVDDLMDAATYKRLALAAQGRSITAG